MSATTTDETTETTWHVLFTPMEEVKRRPDGERWCFVCRTRRPFEFVVSRPIITSLDDVGAYYAPTTQIECTACRTVDGDCFPGTEREWSE